MTPFVFPSLKAALMKGHVDLETDVLMVMLTREYQPDHRHKVRSDVDKWEVSGKGYMAKDFAWKTVKEQNGIAVFSASNLQWERCSITADGCVIYKNEAQRDQGQLVVYFDFPVTQSMDAAFDLEWPENGILAL